jgi:hypothetical protein
LGLFRVSAPPRERLSFRDWQEAVSGKGGDFCFIDRQKRLRIGDEWYRVDVLFFHRRLRCLVIIDLKIGKFFTHADAGQMHLYLGNARENLVHEGENPPVGLILCARKNEAVARCALEGLPNKVMVSEYRTALSDEKELDVETERTQAQLKERRWTACLRLTCSRGRIQVRFMLHSVGQTGSQHIRVISVVLPAPNIIPNIGKMLQFSNALI